MNILACKVIVTFLHVLALSSSFVRLAHRWRTKLLGWDDYAAVIASLFDTVVLTLFWLQYKAGNIPLDEDSTTGYVSFVFSWWTFSFLTYTVIWVSRVAISLSLFRIYPPGHPHRTAALIFVGCLFLLYCVCLLLPTFSCRGTPWWNLNIENCKGLSVASMSALLFAFDFGSDLVLIIGPLYMLRRIKFPRAERALLLSLFSSSVLTLLATLSYCVVYYVVSQSDPDDGPIVMFMSHVQTSVSLIASNLLVVAMMAFRAVRRRYGPFKATPPPPVHPPVPPVPPPPPPVPPTVELPSTDNRPTENQMTQSEITPITLTVLSDGVHIFEPLSHDYDDSSATLPEKKWYNMTFIQPDRGAVSLP